MQDCQLATFMGVTEEVNTKRTVQRHRQVRAHCQRPLAKMGNEMDIGRTYDQPLKGLVKGIL